MVIQLTDKEGHQVRPLLDASLDAELNSGDRDFELKLDADEHNGEIYPGCRIFVAGTEIGGIIGEPYSDTASDELAWKGYTWRGLMEKKIIVPPDGKDHYEVNGELNAILRNLIEPAFDGVFRVPDVSTGVTIHYAFDRFCTLREGLEKMLKSKEHRLEIVYNEGEPNGAGWVDVSAVPIHDYSDEIELSQDSRLNFQMTDKRNGVNHLIVGGKGDMQDRNVFHLYVQEDGTIGDTQYYTGIDEIAEFYENTSTDTSDIESKARERLESLMNKQTFRMDVETLDIDIAIGDIVGGRDYRTGMSMKKPLENIIVVIKNGTIEKEYKLEGTN